MDRRKSLILGVVGASVNSGGSYTVNLNGQWEATTAIPNPDSTLYDGVYRSTSNYNVNSGVATMYIDISGYSEFTLYIRSYAESNYDYVMVSQLDQTITGSTSYSNTTLVKAHTRGNQKSGTTISDYTEVKYTNIDGGSHRITILYRKDTSSHSGDDRGYVLIKKQNASSGGDIEIDTTYAIYYTSSDGNIVELYNNVFGANIISNNYINGQGIISFDGPVTTIGDSAFYECDSLTSVTIPDSVTTIGDSAFYECDSLTSVTIGKGVTKVEMQAFAYCDSLTSVTIPDSVTTIGEQVFYDCYNLTSVTIGKGVTSIGNHAFYSCDSLTSVYCKATTPPSLGGTSVFDSNTSSRQIYVPTNSVSAYKSATNWSKYASSIVGYNF